MPFLFFWFQGFTELASYYFWKAIKFNVTYLSSVQARRRKSFCNFSRRKLLNLWRPRSRKAGKTFFRKRLSTKFLDKWSFLFGFVRFRRNIEARKGWERKRRRGLSFVTPRFCQVFTPETFDRSFVAETRTKKGFGQITRVDGGFPSLDWWFALCGIFLFYQKILLSTQLHVTLKTFGQTITLFNLQNFYYLFHN